VRGAEVDEGGGGAADGAFGVGGCGEVDAADDTGSDPDGDRFEVAEELKVEVAAEDEVNVGAANRVGEVGRVLESEDALDLDVEVDRGVVKDEDGPVGHGGVKDVA
jgi:hypothetical protein